MLGKIFEKIERNEVLTKADAVDLLNIDNYSEEFYKLISEANKLSRKEYGNKGYVFVQIGLNSAPCSGNCKFCSLSSDNFMVEQECEKAEEEVLQEVKQAVEKKVDAVFLMTTADYNLEKFYAISQKVKSLLSEGMMLIANIGDFDLETGKKLKEIGFTGVYHIVRLNEGIDTDLKPEERIRTLDAIRDAGLDLIYCVEPIGPEHSYEQIAEEMLRAREYHVDIMACMKRVAVYGTPMFERGEITDLELTKIVAVTRLVTRPRISMNVHEPKPMTLLAGVNQLYAEMGSNPRDTALDTKLHRGYSIDTVKEMLNQVGYQTK